MPDYSKELVDDVIFFIRQFDGDQRWFFQNHTYQFAVMLEDYIHNLYPIHVRQSHGSEVFNFTPSVVYDEQTQGFLVRLDISDRSSFDASRQSVYLFDVTGDVSGESTGHRLWPRYEVIHINSAGESAAEAWKHPVFRDQVVMGLGHARQPSSHLFADDDLPF